MRAVLVTIATAVFLLSWYRQYLKFNAQNGIFYYLSPTHGEWWLHGASIVLALTVVGVILFETRAKR